jgi:hypothetical protein
MPDLPDAAVRGRAYTRPNLRLHAFMFLRGVERAALKISKQSRLCVCVRASEAEGVRDRFKRATSGAPFKFSTGRSLSLSRRDTLSLSLSHTPLLRPSIISRRNLIIQQLEGCLTRRDRRQSSIINAFISSNQPSICKLVRIWCRRSQSLGGG